MTSEQPIRILQVVTNMSYGGLENFIMNNYRNIDRTRVQFDFLTHFAGHQDYEEEIEKLGGKLYRLPKLNPFDKKYLKELDAFFAAHPEYKVVHSHLNCFSGIILKAAKKSGATTRIAHSHIVLEKKLSPENVLKNFLKKSIPNYATVLFACSEDAGIFMFGQHPFTVINNAIDTSLFCYNPEIRDKLRTALNISDKLVVGHVGMFREQKNHVFLLEVFKELLEKNDQAILLSVGDGPLFEDIKLKADSLGLHDNVIFMGGCNNVHEIMQTMDVMIFPSLYEGFGIVPLEAQTSGLPVIASEAVPNNCILTNCIKQIGLSYSCDKWADAVLDFSKQKRTDNSSAIIDAGFDIKANAKWLEDFYVKKYNGQ